MVIDVSSVIEYLHQYIDALIIHGDLKPQNFLMDSEMTVQSRDFGHANTFVHKRAWEREKWRRRGRKEEKIFSTSRGHAHLHAHEEGRRREDVENGN